MPEGNGKAGPGPSLPVAALYRPTDLAALPFETTDELDPPAGMPGQQRAAEAIHFGTRVAKPGFNLFVIGPPGTRIKESVKTALEEAAPARQPPPDWAYVRNFKEPHKPTAIELPPCRAPLFRDTMHAFVEDLKISLPATFDAEDYKTRRNTIEMSFDNRRSEALGAFHEHAASLDVAVMRTATGFALAPARNGEVVSGKELSQWPREQRRNAEKSIAVLDAQLEQITRQVPLWEKDRRQELRQLNRDTARFAVAQPLAEAREALAEFPRLLQHLEAVEADLVENIGLFISRAEEDSIAAEPGNPFERYEVNILVTQSDHDCQAPVIEEPHPTVANLIGRVEYAPQHGTLMTNFRLIKAGALHRANGGFLLVDARALLAEENAWATLKRVLRSGELVVEGGSRNDGTPSAMSLQPDPIPIDVKVILYGNRELYFRLADDPDVGELFKILADFEDDIRRSPEHEALLAGMIAGVAKKEGLRPVDRAGVALMIEHAARRADHADKLTMVIDEFRDVLIEADFLAAEAGRAVTGRGEIAAALAARVERASRLRDRVQERIRDGIALIRSEGTAIGQVNGLSVVELGGFSFGRPTRITCRVRPGNGRLVDIEREVDLGGPIHSKGVLILSGFLAGRYALDAPMSLFASLVFEQSYGGVDGDSASSGELFALLSALSRLPLRQDLAVTGSVNQQGEIQAIGGVNEKIEGFFDVCKARGLTGTQGVIIPRSNEQHLMLRQDVVDACAAGRFAVYAVASVDEGMALLTGHAAGKRSAGGRYPQGSVNRLVEERLLAFAAIRQRYVRHDEPDQAAP